VSYTVQQPNLGAVLGAGIGKGLSEQLPIEIERYRLSKGLQNFANQYPNSPLMQQYAQLLSIPGVKESPQLLQTFGELAKMQAQASAAPGMGQENVSPEQILKNRGISSETIEKKPEKAPSLQTSQAIQETIRPYLPLTREQKIEKAVDLFKKNPAFYKNDFENALQAAEQEDVINKSRSQQLQSAGQSQINAQNILKNELQKAREKFGAGNIPSDVYQPIENDAIKSMLPKEEGGEGLTQQEATQRFVPQLDQLARDYQAVSDLGDWSFAWTGTPTNIRNLQKKFAKRNDLRNFADTLVAKNDLSPAFAYSLAYPVEQDNKTFPFLKNLKKIDPVLSAKNPTTETRKISEDLAKKMDKESSPLSIAHYLYRKGYDPQVFLDYLVDNQDKLDLTAKQVQQLDKPWQVFPKINDVFLMSKIGIE